MGSLRWKLARGCWKGEDPRDPLFHPFQWRPSLATFSDGPLPFAAQEEELEQLRAEAKASSE